ncbi:hypothetical protein C3L33_21353, partial [Rhododendron williamsianum]
PLVHASSAGYLKFLSAFPILVKLVLRIWMAAATAVKMNGFACKTNFCASDFFFAGLATPQPTNNTLGSIVTLASVFQVPGLNTLGVSMNRIDFAPGGLNPPHEHPRATEILCEDIPTVLFAATPQVPDSVLSKTFQISYQEVDAIKSKIAG